jgi:hypothetical protein
MIVVWSAGPYRPIVAARLVHRPFSRHSPARAFAQGTGWRNLVHMMLNVGSPVDRIRWRRGALASSYQGMADQDTADDKIERE